MTKRTHDDMRNNRTYLRTHEDMRNYRTFNSPPNQKAVRGKGKHMP